MKRAMLYVALAGLAGLLMTGCAATNGGADLPESAAGGMKSVRLEGNGFYEACEEVAPGQHMRYSFTASGPVDFDVHCHTADGKSYPVKEGNITALQGECRAEVGAIHCGMWKNLQATPVDLEYEFFVIP